MRHSRIAAQKAKLLLMQAAAPAPPPPPEESDPRPEMVCFRAQTLAMVRHYFELSAQHGRLPSLMGREFFRAKVSHHAIPSFEEQAVFVRDVELSIGKLNAEHQEIVMLAGIYNLTHEEVAAMLHISKASVSAWFAEALDALSEIFLAAGLLSEHRPDRHQRQAMGRPLVGHRKGPGKVLIATDRAEGALDGEAGPEALPQDRCG
jgi:DNA-directed RNA polymerase specialized sigma24 family protein